MDEWGGLCCGRPMMISGHQEQADIMIEKNRRIIHESGAATLVTSCPICYKVFSQEYNLNIRVIHHTQYLLELAKMKKITLHHVAGSVVYHDPCELSRDVRIYDEPRELLNKMAHVIPSEYEKDNSLCCGNSLANFSSGNDVRLNITKDAYEKMRAPDAQYLVTSCPMCKKAFEKVSGVPVKDIAEIVSRSVQRNQHHLSAPLKKKEKPAEAMID
jgi:Fe-S oxidoreductase